MRNTFAHEFSLLYFKTSKYSKTCNLAAENKIKLYMYNRYVDDTANGARELAPGMRWGEEEGYMIFLPHMVEEDKEVAPDIRTMREVVRMGNSIDPTIQLTGDCPSLNESGKMPLLDTQVWVAGNKVMYATGSLWPTIY